MSIPLDLLIRNLLKYAKTKKEIKKILNKGEILIDNKVRKDHRFPVGILDIITIKSLNENYRLLFNKKGKFIIHKIKKEESLIKPKKITGKKILKNKKIQINFYDGTNRIVDKNIYKVSDTLVINLSKGEIIDCLKFEKGNLIYITKGNKISSMGVLNSLIKSKDSKESRIIYTKGKEKYETSKEYAFVIGKTSSIISLPEDKNE